MAENLLALQVKPLDVATPLLQASRVQQMQSEAQQSQFNVRQQEMGAEFRGLVPYVNHPEFGTRWGEAMDRLAQKGILPPDRHAQLRNSPSPLLLQQGLAMTDSPEIGLQRQKINLQQNAVDRHAGAFGLPSTPVPGAMPTAAPPVGPRPSVAPAAAAEAAADDPAMSIPPRQVAMANAPAAPATAAPPTARPVAVAQAPQAAPAVPTRNPASADLQSYIAAAADPNLPESMRNVALEFVKRELNNSTMTPDQKEYMWARANGDPAAQRPFTEWMRASKRDDPASDAASRRRAVLAEGGRPEDPNMRAFILSGRMPREDQQPLSASDKKAILEADEGVSSATTAITALNRAKVLSKTAMGFRGAGIVAEIGAVGGSQTALDTIELNNVVTTNALSQLKSIFGGNPTEGERKILLEIQGSSNLPHKAREKIFDRAIEAAERRLEMNQQRSNELRGQTFYKPGGGRSQAPTVDRSAAISEAKQAIANGLPRAEAENRLRRANIPFQSRDLD